MTAILWLDEAVVPALHEKTCQPRRRDWPPRSGSIAIGPVSSSSSGGLRIDPDLVVLVVAYAYGITRNHPFIDGNKRTAFTVMELFLNLNGHDLMADDPSCVASMLELAQGKWTESQLTDWLREWTQVFEINK